MRINEDILEQLNIESYTVKKRFFSRRNEVYLINARCINGMNYEFVYKSYVWGDIDNEYNALQKLAGLHVPHILAKGRCSLCMQYIPGKTLLQCLENAEEQKRPYEEYIDLFLRFLQDVYTANSGQIYGDVNLRNFILTKGGLWGVDLEESCKGSISTDIGKAAAFILTYRPAGTEYKQKTASYFIERSSILFGILKQDIEHEKELELAAMKKRRRYTTAITI